MTLNHARLPISPLRHNFNACKIKFLFGFVNNFFLILWVQVTILYVNKLRKNRMKVITKNRKAEHSYFIASRYEAGIVLAGSEVKSLRQGKASIQDSYAEVKNGEMFLYSMYIAPYDKSSHFNHEPRRTRKLLMHRHEINRLETKVKEKGYTLIPTQVYFSDNGKVKIEIALVKGKRKYDKREDIAKRDADRELKRESSLKHKF
ncbi:MAG TPA: SsrA-binding protein SmpB [Bacteroidetes bacterium]|nr:SsrA-binding protein SmpB [Bacteroidota bacterium]